MNQNLAHTKRISSVIAASSGNLVEWFDFYIYGFAAVYFAHNFSNASSPLAANRRFWRVCGWVFVFANRQHYLWLICR